MPTMEAVMDRGETPQLRILGANYGGEAFKATVDLLGSRIRQLRANDRGTDHGLALCAACWDFQPRPCLFLNPWLFLQFPNWPSWPALIMDSQFAQYLSTYSMQTSRDAITTLSSSRGQLSSRTLFSINILSKGSLPSDARLSQRQRLYDTSKGHPHRERILPLLPRASLQLIATITIARRYGAIDHRSPFTHGF